MEGKRDGGSICIPKPGFGLVAILEWKMSAKGALVAVEQVRLRGSKSMITLNGADPGGALLIEDVGGVLIGHVELDLGEFGFGIL